MTFSSKSSAISTVYGYLSEAVDTNVMVWIRISSVLLILFDNFVVRVYGEAQLIFAAIKSILSLDCLSLYKRFLLDISYWRFFTS